MAQPQKLAMAIAVGLAKGTYSIQMCSKGSHTLCSHDIQVRRWTAVAAVVYRSVQDLVRATRDFMFRSRA